MVGSSPLTRGKRFHDRSRSHADRLIPAHAGKTTHQPLETFCDQAHPRSRGENFAFDSRRRTQLGSSPLTRGKPRTLGTAPSTRRLIPAHAGKTSRPWGRAPTSGAHPRSRGENPGTSPWKRRTRGSSPLTRGKLSRQVREGMTARLIPAHAGKTENVWACLSHSTAHPRSRGENDALPQRREDGLGSSPLTRGKRSHWSAQTKRYGLIPAHAGKTAAQE